MARGRGEGLAHRLDLRRPKGRPPSRAAIFRSSSSLAMVISPSLASHEGLAVNGRSPHHCSPPSAGSMVRARVPHAAPKPRHLTSGRRRPTAAPPSPLLGRRARRGGTNLQSRRVAASQAHGPPTRLQRGRSGLVELFRPLPRRAHAALGAAPLSTAPSGTSPHVVKRQSATRSFRARATIAIRRTRPFSEFTRSWNQRLSAEPGW